MRRDVSTCAQAHAANDPTRFDARPSLPTARTVAIACVAAVPMLAFALALATPAQAQLASDASSFRVGKHWPLIGWPTALAAADLDDDGLPDLIVAESMPNRIAIWWNDGYGGLESIPTVIADLPAFAIAAIDADGDGRTDVMWSDSLGLHRALVRPGRQVGPPELIVGAPDLGPLAVGDLDRNGRDDLVLGHGTSVEWMRSGSAGLMAPAALESTGTIVMALAIGGSESRGATEIAVAHEWSYDDPPPDIDVLRIDDHGMLQGTTEVPPPQDFGSVSSLQLADLDRDGEADLIIGGYDGAIAMWGGDFSQLSALGAAPNTWPEDAFNMAVADLDGDGHLDLLTEGESSGGSYNEAAVQTVYGLGGRAFVPNTRYVTDPESREGFLYWGLVLADMDGDGHPDVVTIESGNGWPNSKWLRIALHGSGREIGFERVDRLPDTEYLSDPHVIHRPDLGRDELMASDAHGQGTAFLHLDSEGRLATEIRPDLVGPFVFADVDGDGHEDAIGIRDSISVVHFGTRFDAYAAVETVAVPGLRCVAHLERDRRVALVGVDTAGQIIIAQRQKSGRYTYETLTSSLLAFDHKPYDLPRYLDAAAIPREHGHPDDLVLCAPTMTPHWPPLNQFELLLLRRDRNGDWRVFQHISGTPEEYYLVLPARHPFVIADMNGDGRPDVLFMDSRSEGAGIVHVFLSNADGTLGPEARQRPGLTEEPVSFVVSDVNRDGRLDVVIGAARESDTPWLALNYGDGLGQFARSEFLYLGVLYSADGGVAVADLDGDGVPDLTSLSVGEENALTTLFGADLAPSPPRRHPPRVTPIAAAYLPLAIAAITPMPARDAFDVRFTAPTPEPTRFELLDVEGRRVTERMVNGSGPAHFAVGKDVHSGVYWLRATQGPHSATARVVVLR